MSSDQFANGGSDKARFGKKDTLNKLVDRVLSDDCLASAGHGVKKEESVAVKASNVRDAIAGSSYLIENALAAMMTAGRDEGKQYSDIRMAAMMQAMVDKKVSARFDSANFDIRRRQTIDDILSSPRYPVKVTKALLETEKFFE